MTTWPARGGSIAGPRSSSTAIADAGRIRDASRLLAAALLAVVTVGTAFLVLALRIDSEPPAELQGDVDHATLVQPR